MNAIQVVNNQGTPFNVVLKGSGKDSTIKFYDGRYFQSQFGQFVSEYYASTIMEIEDGYGLNLDGGSPSWYVDEYNISDVKEFIRKNI